MIEGPSGPGRGPAGPMPVVDLSSDGQSAPAAQAVWFAQTEPSAQYSLRFRTLGSGFSHTLVPLNEIMDERYSVYLRNVTRSA